MVVGTSGGRGARTAVVTAAVCAGVVLLGAGCSSAGSTAADQASRSATAGAASASGEAAGAPPAGAGISSAALDDSARRLKVQVEAVADALGPRVLQQSVLVDDPAPCSLGAAAGSWPRRWGYSVSLRVAGPDGAPAARAAAGTLRTRGWAVREVARTADMADLSAVQKGMRIHLLGGERPGELTVEGLSACLRADGSVASA